MKYYSTTEAGNSWGISPRRVALLASQGRIEGAILTGNCWLIPEGAEKPADFRRRDAKKTPISADQYIFPYLLINVHSEKQISSFTEDEKKVYLLCLIYETGDFQQARHLAESYLASDNRYVRLSALYHLPTICMYLSDFDATAHYMLLFRTEVLEDPQHRTELNLLLQSFDAELVSSSDFAAAADFSDLALCAGDCLPYAATLKLFADLISFGLQDKATDFSSHEILCLMTEYEGYFLCALVMHTYLASYYNAVNDQENEFRHIEQAVELALKHNTLFSLAVYFAYHSDTADVVLKKYPSEIAEQIRALGTVYLNARIEYANYNGKQLILLYLTEDDYQLISLCIKNYTIEQMAEFFGLSQSGIKKRLASLYRKLGVKTKSQLSKIYLSSVLDWGKQETVAQKPKQ